MFFFEKITLENFSEHNRSRIIGNSLYRICKTDLGSKNMWHISETYNTKNEFSMSRSYYSYDLQFVIDKINSFTKEKEIIKFIE